MKAARREAARLCELHPGAVIVALGAKVRKAFGVPKGAKAFETCELDGGHRIVLLPHPSGRNRTWGEAGAIKRCRAVLRETVPDLPLGEIGT